MGWPLATKVSEEYQLCWTARPNVGVRLGNPYVLFSSGHSYFNESIDLTVMSPDLRTNSTAQPVDSLATTY